MSNFTECGLPEFTLSYGTLVLVANRQKAVLSMLDVLRCSVISLRSNRTGCSANSKMDAHGMSSFVTSGRENEAGTTSKKQFLSDQFKLL